MMATSRLHTPIGYCGAQHADTGDCRDIARHGLASRETALRASSAPYSYQPGDALVLPVPTTVILTSTPDQIGGFM